MDPTVALDLCDGAARRGELLTMGVPERALARAVRDGAVVRFGPGCYALTGANLAVQRAVQFRSRIGCLTACEGAGLPLWVPSRTPHLVVPRGRSSSRRSRADLRSVVLHRSDAVLDGGVWTPPALALDQATWCCSPLSQLVMIDAALRAGVMGAGDLGAMRLGNARRREWIVRGASALSESPLETVARAGFVSAGLHVDQQVEFDGVGRVDMVVEDRLVVEADGWAFHSDRFAFEADRDRDGALLELGLPVLRVTSRTLRGDLAGVARRAAAIVEVPLPEDFLARIAWIQGAPGAGPGQGSRRGSTAF